MTVLSGKIAIVTGGGSGIGESIAKLFAQEGANIVIGDINIKSAQKVIEEIEGMGRKGLSVQMDVAAKEDADRLTVEALREFGRVDILINNAGITQPPLSTLELDIETWERVTNVDYKGVYLCSRSVGDVMVKQRSGSIINISSIIGLASAPLVTYGPAKSAIIMLTKILATEWGKYNVRVNAIAPGFTLTPAQGEYRERSTRSRDDDQKNSYGRLIEPEDILMLPFFSLHTEQDILQALRYQ
jgi:NAD(P)-dependent dehydrogenase (short-subunit alcohol dehydrogenase family)